MRLLVDPLQTRNFSPAADNGPGVKKRLVFWDEKERGGMSVLGQSLGRSGALQLGQVVLWGRSGLWQAVRLLSLDFLCLK